MHAHIYTDTHAHLRPPRPPPGRHRFNPRGHWVHEAAALLLAEFEREYERIVTKAERHVQVRKRKRHGWGKGCTC